MAHSLVEQLRFTRNEFMRCIDGITENEAQQRIYPMNAIGWMIGHLADQENNYWVFGGLGKIVYPDLNDKVGFGKPPSTPALSEMLTVWQEITTTADIYLESLTPLVMETKMVVKGTIRKENIGTMVYRNTYHYWFHLGEAYSIRQLLGHTNLPSFVGNMTSFNYRSENQ